MERWMPLPQSQSPLAVAIGVLCAFIFLYLFQLNRLLSGTPEEVRRLSPARWTERELRMTYERLEKDPITVESYRNEIPSKQERRYVVTGGSGLVGGYIVLQLLARGQPPESIRIVDYQKPQRHDMLAGGAADVEYVHANISSSDAVDAAFSKPWPREVAHLPLTVFHTAAVIVPSERSKLVYAFCEAVNVRGTKHVLDAARRAGADVLVSSTSGSISIRPVEFWLPPWRLWSSWPKHYWQILDESDFFQPLRHHETFYANYPASKAAAERIVTAANGPSLRTGCIRPANGVYGNPTDNTVGGPLNMGVYPEWTDHIVQSFVHGINAAIAHLHFEAILSTPESASLPQAGRPFTITDPNAPITYGDLYSMLAKFTVNGFRTVPLTPVVMLLISYPIEWYALTRIRYPWLSRTMPAIAGNVKHLMPALFSICTHLVATNSASSRSVAEGGLGYNGVLTTQEGMVQEVIEWNRENAGSSTRKAYRSSVSLADEIQRLGALGSAVGG